jgi:hypothetical protein
MVSNRSMLSSLRGDIWIPPCAGMTDKCTGIYKTLWNTNEDISLKKINEVEH